MRVVVRNPKYNQQQIWGFIQSEFFVYEGEQVPTFKWSEPGTICLTTGDPKFPVRAIHPDDIVSIDDVVPEEPKTKSEERVMLVQGSKGNTYTVTIGPRGNSCTCSGFGFRRSCKHVIQALEAA